MASLVPFTRAPVTTYTSETFTSWATKGWTEVTTFTSSGFDPNGSFAASDFGGLAGGPHDDQLVRTFTGLPADTLVRVAIEMDWNLGININGGPGGDNSTMLFGAWVNNSFQRLSGPTFFSDAPGTLTWLARASSSGTIDVRVGAAALIGSYDVQGGFLSIAFTSVVGEFADLIIDSAVLIVDGMQLTISRGGWSFDPGEQWEDYSFPGRTMNTKGARELVGLKPTIKGNAMMAGEVQISAYRPDGTWADHATIAGARTFTPNALRTYLTATDYLTNVFLVWKRLRNDFIAVEFPVAVCGSYSLGAQDGDEGLFPLVIEAVQDLSTGTTKTAVPYRIHTLPGTTAVGDLPAGSDS